MKRHLKYAVHISAHQSIHPPALMWRIKWKIFVRLCVRMQLLKIDEENMVNGGEREKETMKNAIATTCAMHRKRNEW